MIDFIIVGAQKGGTTAAAFNLEKHPAIALFSGKTEYGQSEIEFFNQHWDRGVEWYLNQLPLTTGIRGEKTAELLHRTVCHERIFSVVPDVKLIVLLRCPIKRAFSQWRMAALNKKDETRSFDEVVAEEYQNIQSSDYRNEFYYCKDTGMSCWREGYLLKGFYFEQLTSLFRYFHREQVHIAVCEFVNKNKSNEYNRMFSFLNVDTFHTDFEDRFIGKEAEPMNTKTYDFLKDIYSKPNEQLFNLLGYDISEWSKK